MAVTRGEFNNARARRALVDWYLSLFVMCKAWHQYNERLLALALLNSPQLLTVFQSTSVVFFRSWSWFPLLIFKKKTELSSCISFNFFSINFYIHKFFSSVQVVSGWFIVLLSLKRLSNICWYIYKDIYCRANQEWRWRHALFTIVK